MTYLICGRGPHVLDNLLGLGQGNVALLGNDLNENRIDLTGHVGCVATDVKVGLLQEELINLRSALLEPVLHIYFVWPVAREGRDEFELVTEGFFALLYGVLVLVNPIRARSEGGDGWIRVSPPTLIRTKSPGRDVCSQRKAETAQHPYRPEPILPAPA